LLIDLPTLAERPNKHLDIKSAHKRFSSRLDEFIRLSHAVVVAPGGIGTLLELMYVWQLIQLHMLEERPVILLGREFWAGFLSWMRAMPADHRLINPEDLDALIVVDTADEAMALIQRSFTKFQATQAERVASVASEEARLKRAADEMALDLANQVRFTEVALAEIEGLAPAA
jgi:predicted Rossmann-fold nucleotide-binding protein